MEPAGPSTSGMETGSVAGPNRAKSSASAGQRRRGRSPADKEHKRLKRYGNMIGERAKTFANLRGTMSIIMTPLSLSLNTYARLLRNRVSAQQARERKKAYLNDLEAKVNDLEKKNSELEERLSTLQNENQMLRQILKNTTVSRRGSSSSANGEGK